MGINLILRSDMFGLQTTLDRATNNDLIRRNILASQETLSSDEEGELKTINNKLDKLGFSLASDDPDYMDFLIQKYHSKPGEAN